MNFTNINDPAGVKALLEQLRSSQAWQEVVQQPQDTTNTSAETITQGSGGSQSSATSVASLLSQLQPSASFPPSTPKHPSGSGFERAPTVDSIPSSFSGQKSDITSFTFQQAIPHLARLCNDPTFVGSINQLKKEQDSLERQLWAERRAIQKKYEEKVEIAKTKAKLIGGLSKHEADAILESFKKELHKFDLERVLPAWDGLVANQQASLALRGVPTMFTTDVAKNIERQQRVMQVLEGLVSSEDD